MGVFLYFLPNVGRTTLTPQRLAAAGLSVALRDCLKSPADMERTLIVRDVVHGPKGGAGCIVAPKPRGRELDHQEQPIGWHPDRQDWQGIGPDPTEPYYWLGTDRTAPPTAEDVARRTIVSGYSLTLGDGQVWECPTIRRPAGTPNLPRCWGVDPAGQFTEQILPEFDWAWELAGQVWDVVFGQVEIERPEAYQIAVQALSLNYRLGPHEIARLRLLNSENYSDVFKATVDGQLIEDFFKTPEGQAALRGTAATSPAASSSVSPGPVASTPTIDPVGPPSGWSPPATPLPVTIP